MELWIRSQNREKIVKADCVTIQHEYEQKAIRDSYGVIIDCITGKYEYSKVLANNTFLGTYKTKERALEILDEIQQFINNGGCSIITQDSQSISLNAYKVYEMPKE